MGMLMLSTTPGGSMKRLVLVGALMTALSVTLAAQRGKPTTQAGHTAPKPQPVSAPAPSIPTGEIPLGSVHLGKGVKADGKTLAPGTYQLRLTAQSASPDAKGQTPSSERWVEFVQRGQVKGREVVTIVPQSEIDKVQKDAPPHANASKVEMLKGGDYLRVWINRGGKHYLLHLPTA